MLLNYGALIQMHIFTPKARLRGTVVTRWIILIWAPGSNPGGVIPILFKSSFEFFERFVIYRHPISGSA